MPRREAELSAQAIAKRKGFLIEQGNQDAVANIDAAPTVDDAIAAAEQAVSQSVEVANTPLPQELPLQDATNTVAPADEAVDNIARLLGQEPANVSQPVDVPPVATGADGIRGVEPGISLDAGMGTRGTSEPTLDAGGQGDLPVGGTAPLGTQQPAELNAEPTSTWFGRRGDGYQAPDDAAAALPTRQRVAPELQWKIEQMPSGRYRLAGYEAQQAVAPTFKATMNPTGTATIYGDPSAIKAQLAQAGIDKVVASADRVVVGVSQAQAAMQAIESSQAPAIDNEVGSAVPLADVAAPRSVDAMGKPASWVIRNKESGEVLFETFDAAKVGALNTAKYEAVPIGDYLGSINGQQKAPASVGAGAPMPTQGAPVLQNRNRATPSSITQMQSIAANPDYGRLGFSRDFANGAPVVAGGEVAPAQMGRSDVAVASNGRRIPVQYAVVEADDVLASNNVDGSPNEGYGNQAVQRIRAIAGNGRIAGLQAAYGRGTGQKYINELTADNLHGVSQDVIRGMRAPVLVRVMPNDQITSDIGDLSNTASNLDLSAVEQANNDARRVNLDALQFSEDGGITAEAVRQFVRAMPQTEQGGLIDTNGQPTKQAVDRISAAVFAKAYGNDQLVRLFAQAQDPEARIILSALAQVAPKMARLEGAGALDIRGVVTQAAEIAVNARREGKRLALAAQQLDMAADPDVAVVLDLFATNSRSVKTVVEALTKAADFSYTEATKPSNDMFGEVPRASRADVFNQLSPQNEQRSQENLEDAAGSGTAQVNVGRAEAGPRANEDAGAIEAGRPAQVEELLAAPSEADVLAQQGRRDNAEALDQREQVNREASGQTLTNPVAPEQRRDSTGDAFGGPTVEDAEKAIEAERKAKAKASDGPDLFGGLTDQEEGQKPEAKPVADMTPAELLRAAADKMDAKSNDATKIKDFGEKIGGAKKDIWTGFKDDLSAVADDEIAGRKLSEIWPAPDYQKLIDGGMDSKSVAVIRSLRDEIPSKPRNSYKLKRWAEQVKSMRDMASDILGNKETASAIVAQLERGTDKMRGLAGRVDLYEAVGHGKSLEGIRLAHHHYTLYRGRENVRLWVVDREAAATAFSNWPQELATGDTKEDAIAAFKARYSELDAIAAVKKASFDIYAQDGKVFIGKKIGRNIAEMAGPFESVKAAREYRANNLPKLDAKLAKYKEIPQERRDTNDPRVGEDMRNGQDVTPEMFGQAFGFRGVEFGNWVEQKRRQKDLNDAYDALMDMAAIMGVPAKAISLNGELGLAFGARGAGGINPAAAHYEADKIVINLTKREGAGSLGHEWWHAVDNYFSRMRGNRTSNFMTTATDVGLSSRGSNYVASPGVRKEMIDAFGAVVKAIKQTAIKARSSKLDAKRSKEYWVTGEEMAARAFESYLIAKLQDQNASNDYLANVVDQKTWDAMAALGMENDDSYPYPTAGEMPVIREGFDNFFDAIQTKETDKGMALYSRAPAWTSDLRDKLADAKMESSKEEGWRAFISGLKTKGVKPDEIEWSGVNEWLQLQTGKVTKAQVLDYLDGNGVKVEEVTLGDDNGREKYIAELNALSRADLIGRAEDLDIDVEAINGNRADIVDAILEAQEGDMPAADDRADGSTKYSQYTLPGGTNYREVLLTLPRKEKTLTEIEKELGYETGKLTNAQQDEVLKLWKQHTNKSADYSSSHWDTPNVLAHIRVNDRVDADGSRVLFVEEIQSDFGQDAKKKGVAGTIEAALKANGMTRAEFDAMPAEDQQFAIDETKRMGLPPNAPFIDKTDKWLTLALKRIITMAAQEGYDKVAFVNGEQSAERYDLSKQVDSLEWLTRPTGAKMVSIAIGSQPVQLIVNEEGKVIAAKGRSLEQADGKMLDEVLGKDAASQIMAEEKGQLSDLKVGGEGMKVFYDQIVPNTLKGVLKKVGGAGMETVELQIPGLREGDKDSSGTTIGPKGVPGKNFDATGFTITDDMRNKASNGLPTFKRSEGIITPMAQTQAQAAVDAITAKWKSGPKVKVVNTYLDLPVKAPRDVKGMYYKGVAYVVALRHRSAQDVGRTLAHEVIAHHGLRNMLGRDDWMKLMNQVQFAIKAGNKPMAALRDTVRERYVNEDGTYTLSPNIEADEIIALGIESAVDENGEFKPGYGMFKAVWAKIAMFLRDMGINIKFTNAELQGMLVLAQRELETGKKAEGGGEVLVAASRGEDAQASRGTNEPVTKSNDVVGNQGGRSADDISPGAAKRNALLTQDEFDRALAFVKEVESLAEKHGAVYVRWSASEKHDLSADAKSRDYGSGEIHAGLSSQKIDADMHPVTIARRIAEYNFVRGFGNNKGAYPRIYTADEVGTDSDNAVSITNLKKVIDVPKSFVAAIDKKFHDAYDYKDSLDTWEKRGNNELVSEYTKKLRSVLENESPAPTNDGAFARIDQTETPEFKAWFKGSAVVDAEGKPLRVYHGTAGNFGVFDGEKASTASMHATAYIGHYFSASPEVAGGFVPQHWDMTTWPTKVTSKQGGNIMPLFLNVRNPYDMPITEFRKMVPDGRSQNGVKAAKALRERLQAQGHDGIHIVGDAALKDTMAGDEWSADTWIVFQPTQIKSVFNRGTFDPNDPDIRYSRGPDALADTLSKITVTDQTDTPEFKAWFKGSKVVDAEGKPLRVYHGTKAEFTEFKRTSGGEFGPAIYMTDSSREASEYGDGKGWGGPSGTQVMPLYASIKKPYTKGVDDFWKEFGTGGTDAEGVAAAQAAGYDGIITKRADRYYDNEAREFVDRGGKLTHYIAFDPSQIKSAIGNRGTFDPNDPDIRYSRTGTADDIEADQRPELSPWRDATGSLQFAPGAWLYEKIGSLAGPMLAKTGMKAASPELRHIMRNMKIEVSKAQEVAAAVAGEATKLTDAERAMVSDLIEKELAAGTIPPQHAVKLAATINASMEMQTNQLVELGMLSADSAERWRGEYLPRYYESKLTRAADDAWGTAMRSLTRQPSAMKGIKGKHLRGRGMYETIPESQLADWESLGWEVRDPDFQDGLTKDGTVQVWRDYTRQERDSMGEIRDAGFRFVMGYMQTQKDIALGTMFQELASRPDMSSRMATEKMSVQVPTSTVAGTGVKTYGKLSGRWVEPETLSQLTAIEESHSDVMQMYRKAMSIWKESKTVLNPVSHVNNTISNMSMAHFAGVSYHRADKYLSAMRDFAKKSPLILEAKEAGLFLGTLSEAELMNTLPEELKILAQKQSGTAEKFGRSAFNLMTFYLRKPMGWAYQAEDTFFRYLLYKHARESGMETADSVDYAQKYIFTYDDLPKGARRVRDFAVPFFAYTYKAIPALLHTAMVHPLRMAGPAAVLWAANAAAYAIAVGDEDDSWDVRLKRYLTDPEYRGKAMAQEKMERELLPDWNKGTTSLMSPKVVRLGNDELSKLPVFLDVSRIVPGGDLFDVNPNAGGIPLPQPITPSHPLFTSAVALLANRDLYFGKDLTDNNDTSGEKFNKRAAWIWKQMSPAIAAGNYHWERGMNALAQATGGELTYVPDFLGGDATGIGRDGLPVQPGYAVMHTFGIKARLYDFDTAAQIDQSMKNKMIRDIDTELRKLQRLNNKGALNDRGMEKARELAQTKKERLREGLTVDGDERD